MPWQEAGLLGIADLEVEIFGIFDQRRRLARDILQCFTVTVRAS